MRNIENQIKRVNRRPKLLSQDLVMGCKMTLNQYNRGWLKFQSSDAADAVSKLGLRTYLETPMIGQKLDAELTKRGITWLRNLLYKSNGKPRNTVHTREVGQREYSIVDNFSHFTFEGFYSDGNGELTPIWGVHSKQGQSFKYVCTLGAYNIGGYWAVIG